MSSIYKNITRVRDIARNQKFRVQYVQQPVLAEYDDIYHICYEVSIRPLCPYNSF